LLVVSKNREIEEGIWTFLVYEGQEASGQETKAENFEKERGLLFSLKT
jgi:hypothetical protein